MTTDFIEFETNECVSDDKETDTKSSVVVAVVPRRFEDLLHRQYDGVDLRNV